MRVRPGGYRYLSVVPKKKECLPVAPPDARTWNVLGQMHDTDLRVWSVGGLLTAWRPLWRPFNGLAASLAAFDTSVDLKWPARRPGVAAFRTGPARQWKPRCRHRCHRSRAARAAASTSSARVLVRRGGVASPLRSWPLSDLERSSATIESETRVSASLTIP